MFDSAYYSTVLISICQGQNFEELKLNEICPDEDEVFYNHCDQDLREEVDITTLPLFHNDGHEILVYDEDGNRVICWRASELGEPCGALFKLSSLDQNFSNNPNDLDPEMAQELNHEQIRSTADLILYPQAFLHDKGHYQSKTLSHGFSQRVEAIADAVVRGEDEMKVFEEHLSPIMAVASQGYNVIFHRLRYQGRASHDAQQGLITGAAALQFVSETRHKQKRQELQDKLANGRLPFNRFQQRLNTDNHHVDLRLENVYLIDMLALSAEYCSPV
jgi:hypothetical protein